MPSLSRKKSGASRPAARSVARRRSKPRPRPIRPVPKKKTGVKSKPRSSRPAPKSARREPSRPVGPVPEPAATPATLLTRSPSGRSHLLSLAFLRDGDEFFTRIETNSGQITEFKNRSLDQLLTLVAGELEDLLE